MSYDRQWLNLEFGFTTTTPEIAVTNIHYSAGEDWVDAVAALAEIGASDSTMQDILSELSDLMSLSQCSWADYSTLASLKVSARGTTGAYLTDPVVYLGDPTFTGAIGNTAPQESIVLSLRSGFHLGKANFGRMYLPHTRLQQVALAMTGTAGNAATVAEGGVNFVNGTTVALNAVTTDILRPMILSSQGVGTSREVTQVAVGVVTDTQRRRRNKLDENYQFQSL